MSAILVPGGSGPSESARLSLLQLPGDALGVAATFLAPREALRLSHACRALREDAFRVEHLLRPLFARPVDLRASMPGRAAAPVLER